MVETISGLYKAEGARPCSSDGPTPHARGRRMRHRGLGRLV